MPNVNKALDSNSYKDEYQLQPFTVVRLSFFSTCTLCFILNVLMLYNYWLEILDIISCIVHVFCSI